MLPAYLPEKFKIKKQVLVQYFYLVNPYNDFYLSNLIDKRNFYLFLIGLIDKQNRIISIHSINLI